MSLARFVSRFNVMHRLLWAPLPPLINMANLVGNPYAMSFARLIGRFNVMRCTPRLPFQAVIGLASLVGNQYAMSLARLVSRFNAMRCTPRSPFQISIGLASLVGNGYDMSLARLVSRFSGTVCLPWALPPPLIGLASLASLDGNRYAMSLARLVSRFNVMRCISRSPFQVSIGLASLVGNGYDMSLARLVSRFSGTVCLLWALPPPLHGLASLVGNPHDMSLARLVSRFTGVRYDVRPPFHVLMGQASLAGDGCLMSLARLVSRFSGVMCAPRSTFHALIGLAGLVGNVCEQHCRCPASSLCDNPIDWGALGSNDQLGQPSWQHPWHGPCLPHRQCHPINLLAGGGEGDLGAEHPNAKAAAAPRVMNKRLRKQLKDWDLQSHCELDEVVDNASPPQRHLKVAFANVDSLNSRIGEIAALMEEQQLDVLALAETRLRGPDLPTVQRAMASRGFTYHGQQSADGAAGVGLLTSTACRYAPISDTDMDKWSAMGRFMSGWLIDAQGRPLTQLAVLYSFADPLSPERADATANLWNDLQAWTLQYTGGKFCIMGDMNCVPGEIQTFDQLMAAGYWHDVLMEAGEFPRPCTHVAGRAIDYIMASTALSTTIIDAKTWTTWPFPNHRPVQMTLDMHAKLPEELVKLNQPTKLPADPAIKQLLAKMSPSDLEGLEELDAAKATGDPDKIILAWSQRWEAAYLSAAARLGHTAHAHQRGRGSPEASPTFHAPPKRPGREHESLPIRQLRRSIGMVRAWLVDEGEIPDGNHRHHDVLQRRILARLGRLHGIECAFLSAVTVNDLQQRLRTAAAEDKRERLRSWRAKMTCIPEACRYVRNETFKMTPQALQLPDGSWAVGYEKMNAALVKFWKDIAVPKHTTLSDISAFVDQRTTQV